MVTHGRTEHDTIRKGIAKMYELLKMFVDVKGNVYSIIFPTFFIVLVLFIVLGIV